MVEALGRQELIAYKGRVVPQLTFVIFVMLIQQTFAYMGTLVLPNMGPVVAAAIGVDPYLVGYYTSILFFFSSMG